VTPVTVAIGRVNNPDALLVLLMVGAAYLLVRALESGRTKPLVWCGVLVGLAFMTKMLQGWMIAPALAVTYLVAAPVRVPQRIRQLALAGAAMIAASAAWPLAVTLWPGSKPYIGGSTDGSVWDVILGYNGLGRITGGTGTGQGASFGGAAGLWRMFNQQVGGQIAWLLPLAAVSLLVGLWLTRRAPRTDRARAAWILFGSWALVHVAVFSTQKGIFHPYYVSALAPAVAALSGAGLVTMARWARTSYLGHAVLASSVLGTAWLAVELLGRSADFAPALRVLVPIAAVVAVAASAGLHMSGPVGRRMLAVAAVAMTVAVAAGPTSYSVANLSRSMSGNNVLAGPASIASGGMGGGPSGSAPSSGAGGARPTPTGATSAAGATARAGDSANATLIAYLQAHQGSAKYLVAASGSQTTAGIIIATGQPVATIGGFNGADPAPTVTQLAQMVAKGELRFVLIGSGGGAPGGSATSIATWVKAHGTAVTSVGTSSGTLYRVTV
jgi:4-amino-4-deoxy-L-arabinose transferase-like glycosyltransferase